MELFTLEEDDDWLFVTFNGDWVQEDTVGESSLVLAEGLSTYEQLDPSTRVKQLGYEQFVNTLNAP
jgi:hypothetical protein